MDVLEKFLHSIAYKFPKGYPDVSDPKDKDMLFKMIHEVTEDQSLLNENSEVYDKTILRALGTETIPTSKNTYKFGVTSTFDVQVKESDMNIWKKLYEVAPPKKGEEEGQTKGVGNGEVALYWLYNYSNSKIEVKEGRSGDDPDLFFNGTGVEVKAYKSHNGKISLGRFGADKENLRLLGLIFGLNALVRVLGKGEEVKTINPTNFKGIDLPPALENVIKLKNIDLSSLAQTYPLFATIKQNIDLLSKSLGDFSNSEEGAINMTYKLLNAKLGRKPRDKGYLANVKPSGDIKFFYIDLEKVKSNEDILKVFGVTQSSIGMNFSKIF